MTTELLPDVLNGMIPIKMLQYESRSQIIDSREQPAPSGWIAPLPDHDVEEGMTRVEAAQALLHHSDHLMRRQEDNRELRGRVLDGIAYGLILCMAMQAPNPVKVFDREWSLTNYPWVEVDEITEAEKDETLKQLKILID